MFFINIYLRYTLTFLPLELSVAKAKLITVCLFDYVNFQKEKKIVIMKKKRERLINCEFNKKRNKTTHVMAEGSGGNQLFSILDKENVTQTKAAKTPPQI